MPQDQDDIKGADAMKQAPTPGPLWMMHVIGPDDIHPAPDHATAVEWCASLNASVPKNDVLCVAVPAIWIGTPEAHAEGLSEAVEGWTSPRQRPTTPVEASGSGWEQARIEIEKAFAEGITPEEILSWFRPQPSGETRKGPTKAEILGVVRQYCAPAWCSVDRLTDALHALSAHPAPVASGGQHSSGEVACVIAFREGKREPDLVSWNALPIGEHRLYTDPVAETAGEAVAIVPPGCTGTALSFDPGVLHVSKDGSGYIAINEKHFELEDDRCEGPDGPEGSVHWITRLDASEMAALRDFLNGSTPAAQDDDKLRGPIAHEIKQWAETRWPKHARVGSVMWVAGLTNRILAALKSTAAQEGGE